MGESKLMPKGNKDNRLDGFRVIQKNLHGR
nr:MAG TPA: hypothetical protein [Caudoviricetes sp.]